MRHKSTSFSVAECISSFPVSEYMQASHVNIPYLSKEKAQLLTSMSILWGYLFFRIFPSMMTFSTQYVF